MYLNQLGIGKTAVIESVGGDGALRQHFLDMGVIPGTQITLIKYAPMGDPMELELHGYSLTLRVDDAKKIGIRYLTDEYSVRDNTEILSSSIEHPGLGEDGICAEGFHYWHYGFGFFTVYVFKRCDFRNICGK